MLGTLVAKGTAEQPIVLTSYKDDTAHGDTNGDGTATTPSFGDWVGVGFAVDSPGGVGEFVEIRHAGYYGAAGTNFSQDASTVDARVQIACMRCHLFPDPGDSAARAVEGSDRRHAGTREYITARIRRITDRVLAERSRGVVRGEVS